MLSRAVNQRSVSNAFCGLKAITRVTPQKAIHSRLQAAERGQKSVCDIAIGSPSSIHDSTEIRGA